MASDEENVRENPISIEALLHKLNRKTATLISAFILSLLEETMITLYEMYPTRSQRAKWALEEIGVQYNSKTVDMRAGAHRQTEYTAINPMQVMPTLACTVVQGEKQTATIAIKAYTVLVFIIAIGISLPPLLR